MFRRSAKNLVFLVFLLPATAMADANALNSIECFDHASQYHDVNASILRSIAIKESSGCRRNGIRKNKNNSADIGCMQINSVHFDELAKFGIDTDDLTDQCKNIYVAAWLYKKRILQYGNNWLAVGAYHSRTPTKRDAYARDVYNIWKTYFN